MTTGDPRSADDRVADVERRLAFLETELAALREQLAARAAPDPTPPQTPAPHPPSPLPIRRIDAPPASPIPVMPASAPAAPPTAPPPSSTPVPPASQLKKTFLDLKQDARSDTPPQQPFAPLASPPSSPSNAPPALKPARAPSAGLSSIEAAIGGRWYALIGAVIVLIGLGLFLKLAIDQHWLSFPPAARCAGVALAGFALLAGGEWARRKLTRAASAGFSAAGIGALIASVWAAHRLYDLTGPVLAFILMALACAVGVFVAARARLASVAVVALLGAYTNPFIVGDSGASKVGFFAYLILVLATGLTLPMWKGPRFAGVRILVWWGTILVGGGVAGITATRSEPVSPLAFVALSWFLIQAELSISAGRFGLVHRSLRRSRHTSAPPPHLRELFNSSISSKAALASFRAWRPIASSFSTTAWAVVLATLCLQQLSNIPSWLAPAFFAAVTLTGAHILSGHLRFLTDVPENDSERLGAAYAVQSGALIIAAVSMALSGGVQVIAWLAMGVAAIAGGRWIRSRPLDVYGLIVISLGTARLIFFDSHVGIGATISSTALGLALGPWTLLALTASGAWLAAAWLLRQNPTPIWRLLSTSSIAIALTVAGLATTLLAKPAPATLVVWSLVALALATIARRLPSRGLVVYGLVVLSLSSLLGLIGCARLFDGPSSTHVAGLSLTTWTFASWFTALVWFASAGLARTGDSEFATITSTLALAIGFTLACFSTILLSPLAPASAFVIISFGVAIAFTSTRLRSDFLAAYALIFLFAGTLHGPLAGAWRINPSAATSYAGLIFSTWSAAAIFASAGWCASRLAFRSDPGRTLTVSIGFILALMLVPLHTQAAASSISLAWLAIAVFCVLASKRTPWTQLTLPALVLLVFSVLAWLFAYSPLNGRWPADSAPPFLSLGLLSGLALTLGIGACAWLLRADQAPDETLLRQIARRTIPALTTVAIVLLWLSTSMEAGRVGEILTSDRTVQKASVSVWWGIFGLALISAGFLWKSASGQGVPIARRAGLALVALAVLKALIWDLIQVPPMARVISFVGLGLLMMAVTVIYAKLTGKLIKPPAAQPPPSPAPPSSDAPDATRTSPPDILPP